MSETVKINSWLLCATLMFSLLSGGQTINTGILFVEAGTQVSTIEALDNKNLGVLVNDGELFVYNHFNNDGLVTFTSGQTTGIIRMRGLLDYQDISGKIPIELYNIEFNNSNVQPAFHLSNEVRIFGNASFYKGIIDNDVYGGQFVFENGSSHSDASDGSYVEGHVRKKGNEAFIFPVGNQTKHRFSGISAPENEADSFTGKYFFQNANSLYPLASKDVVIENINDTEYWILDKTSGTSDVMLTLSWDETTTPEAIVASPETAIHIVRWDTTKNLWVDEGGVVDSVAKKVTTPINVSGYSVFTTARVTESAPDSLVFYNGISSNEDGLNGYFRIEGLTGTDNMLEIFNRWGSKVYATKAYNTTGNVFRGQSEGVATINSNQKLPVGTYFYVFTFKVNGKVGKKAGYLYLKYN